MINTQEQTEFKKISIDRNVTITQNEKTGKLDLTIKLKSYDLQELLLEKNTKPAILKKIIGKVNISVEE